ncbi:hypothetical protein [Piscinibacter defluvii]|uniref:hypothetical protein n=1 Tax=Piscinibacter defluvii TaxID=1796922 RepID=UPI000FDEF6EF|nr:hypothetical protein [Piscinibacter defluvii]
MGRIRMLHRLAALLVLAALAACGGGPADDDEQEAAPAPVSADGRTPRTTVDAAIAAARDAGEIDAQTALAYRVFALAGDARLPERFRPAADAAGEPIDEVDGNAVIADLRLAWEGLSASMRQQLAPFTLRPSAATGWAGADAGRVQAAAVARPACAANATWASLPGAVARVRVWYDKSRTADLTQAQAIVAAFDATIWPTLVTGLGFKAPLSDLALACDGGDNRLDVYIVAGFGSRGATYPESASTRQSSSFIVVRSGLAAGVLQYTLAHQFMHAVMWSYLMAADQLSYGWMRNALANWAVEASYPGNATLLADASCHMNSNFLSITSRAAGSCAASTTRTRDYGAYLLYQFIGRTMGNTTVRQLLAATTTQLSALAAIEAVLPGGRRALWPKYAKALWNQPPVTNAGRPAFRNWDGLTTVAVLAPDHPTTVNANLGGVAEASTALASSVANVSTRYYRFTFSDVATRSLMVRNTFYPPYKAGKAVSVQALWRAAGGSWVEEDWTAKEWIGFCRDAKAQRLAELVVIVASADIGSTTQVVAATAPTVKRNNIGCWGFSGSARRTDILGSWSSGTITATSTLLFDYKPNGLASLQYNDAATGRLRVPIAAPLFRRAAWTLSEAYTESGCSYLLNASATDTSIVLGGLAFGSIVINNFAESLPASLRVQQQGVVGSRRGAYSIDAGSQRFGLLGSVSGPQPDCGTQYASAPGMFALTHTEPALAPVIGLDGRLKGSWAASSSPDSVVFSWDLAPLREP